MTGYHRCSDPKPSRHGEESLNGILIQELTDTVFIPKEREGQDENEDGAGGRAKSMAE